MTHTSSQTTVKWASTVGILAGLLLIGGGIPAMAAQDREHRKQISESIKRVFGEIGRALPQQAPQAGAVPRGQLGVRVQNLEAERARAIGLDAPRGALITDVAEDSPAEQAKLQPDDVILAFNGKPIADVRQLQRVVAATSMDLPVEIVVWRNGQRRSLSTRTARLKDQDMPFDYAEAAQRLEAKRSDAIPLIRPAAERGEPGALFLMGLAHWHGIEVRQDAALAERYMQEASNRGFVKATAILAIGLISGKQGFRKDPQAGLELAQAAARSREPRGLVALAVAYAAGLVPGKGEAEAMALLRKAAEANDRMAQALLASTEANARPPYWMSQEEAEYFSPSGRAGDTSLDVQHLVAKLKENPNIAHYYYRNVPPHSDCLQYWHKPGVPESYENSMLVCTIYNYYMGRIIRSAHRHIAAADAQIQVDNFRHYREQSQRTQDIGRTSRDMREGYYSSYGLGGAETQGFPSDSRNW